MTHTLTHTRGTAAVRDRRAGRRLAWEHPEGTRTQGTDEPWTGPTESRSRAGLPEPLTPAGAHLAALGFWTGGGRLAASDVSLLYLSDSWCGLCCCSVERRPD